MDPKNESTPRLLHIPRISDSKVSDGESIQSAYASPRRAVEWARGVAASLQWIEAFWVIAASLVQFVCSLAMVKLLTTSFSVEFFGRYSLVMSIVIFVCGLPFACIDQAVVRYVSIYQGRQIWNSAFRIILIGYGALLIAYISLSAIGNFLFMGNTLAQWRDLMWVLPGLVIVEVIKNLGLAIQNAERRRRQVVLYLISDLGGKTVIIWVTKVLFDGELGALFVGYMLVTAIVISLMMPDIAVRARSSNMVVSKREVVRDLILFAYPFILWFPFQWLQNMSDRWLLSVLLNESAAGEFVAIASIASFPFAALGGIGSAFFLPIIYQNDHRSPNGNSEVVHLFVGLFLVVGTVVTIIFYLFGETIIALVTDSKYVAMAPILPIVSIGKLLLNAGMLLAWPVFVRQLVDKLIVPNVVAGCVAMGVGYALTARFGLWGAAITSVVVGASYMTMVAAVSVRATRNTRYARSG